MSPREFASWWAYWRLEPWGAWRDDYHHARALQQLIASHTPKEKASTIPSVASLMFEDPKTAEARREREQQERWNEAMEQMRRIKRGEE